ncbi:hypothetical protein ACNHYB_11560 [Isoptericola jiangsuensis]|uniref:hypothetical protein n=1 Tax=Isoptericola jiangsuensis TaxID=548579 RepID=UPI003AAEC32E
MASSCTGSVKVEPVGSPDESDTFTAIMVSRVADDGTIEVRDSWDRQEGAGVKVAKGATAEQQAIIDDATSAGLVGSTSAPRLADPQELLVGKDEGKYVQYSYTTRSVETLVVSCGDGSSPVDATATSFEVVETGLVNCKDTPDPVTEYIASEAITIYCERG